MIAVAIAAAGGFIAAIYGVMFWILTHTRDTTEKW